MSTSASPGTAPCTPPATGLVCPRPAGLPSCPPHGSFPQPHCPPSLSTQNPYRNLSTSNSLSDLTPWCLRHKQPLGTLPLLPPLAVPLLTSPCPFRCSTTLSRRISRTCPVSSPCSSKPRQRASSGRVTAIASHLSPLLNMQRWWAARIPAGSLPRWSAGSTGIL